MLPGYRKKIEEIKAVRAKAWKPVRALEQEINRLKKLSKELDEVLIETFSIEKKRQNGYMIILEEKQKELRENYPIRETKCIDYALEKWENDRGIDDDELEELMKICRTCEDLELRYQASLMVVVFCKRVMQNVYTYQQCMEYQERMDEVMSELVKMSNADIFYAQWGKILYEQCIQKVAEESLIKPRTEKEKRDMCVHLLKKANNKFQHVQTKVEGIECYLDFVPGNEANEVELLLTKERAPLELNEPLEILHKLLEDKTDANREIIRNYRGKILDKVLWRLASACVDIKVEKQKIRTYTDTFSGDVEDMLSKYEKTYRDFCGTRNATAVSSFMSTLDFYQVIPTEYKKISTEKYREDLRKNLHQKAKQLLPETPDEKWLHSQTLAYVNQNKEQFDSWMRDYIKANSMAEYRGKMRAKVDAQLTGLPSYAINNYNDVASYKNDIYKRCTDVSHCKELEESALKKQWFDTIPNEVIEKYFKSAEAEIRTEIKEQEKKQKSEETKKVWKSIPGKIGGFFAWCVDIDLTIGGILKAIVIFIFASGIIGAAKDALPSGAFINESTMTDEELLQAKEAAIDEIEVELSSTASPVSDFTYEVVDYMNGGKVIEIVKYNGTDEIVEIPAVIDGKNVAYIRAGAFADNFLIKKVIMPDTIWKIHDGSIVGLFQSPGAFTGCENLEEVVLSKNLTHIGNGAFFKCTSLKSVQIEGGELSSLQTISDYAFSACYALESITIQTDTYRELKIGQGAFGGDTVLNDIRINGERLESIVLGGQAFQDCTSLEGLPFTDKITTIGDSAFKNCVSLNGISLPNVTNIPADTFRDCIGLTNFEISNKVTGIENYAFAGCTNLSTVTFEALPEGEEATGRYIREYVFSGCKIVDIEIPGCYEQIGQFAFGDCEQLTKFVWHAGNGGINQNIDGNMLGNSVNLSEIYLPKTVKQFEVLNIPSSCTIYAAENSAGYSYAMANNLTWSTWTE